MMKILLLGYGKMGHLVEELALQTGHEVVGRIGFKEIHDPKELPAADVAIDFSVANGVGGHINRLGNLGVPMVIGTTGWSEHEAKFRAIAERAGIGVVASANFSIGVNVFQMIAAETARRLAAQADYGAWIHEAHHDTKKDAPSGTALLLRDVMTQAGFGRAIDISSTRAGRIPGTHTIGFDSVSDTIELTHTARDRSGFARGALLAAQWVRGRRGWFSMADVLANENLG